MPFMDNPVPSLYTDVLINGAGVLFQFLSHLYRKGGLSPPKKADTRTAPAKDVRVIPYLNPYSVRPRECVEGYCQATIEPLQLQRTKAQWLLTGRSKRIS